MTRSPFLNATTLRGVVRGLARDWTYTTLAVGTLAIGSAAAIVMFSILNALILRPLPFSTADQLYALSVTHADPSGRMEDFGGGSLDVVTWQERATTVRRVAALNATEFAVGVAGAYERVPGAFVSAGFIDAHGDVLRRGRTFSATEEASGARVALVSEEFWGSRLGAAADVIGSSITINNEVHTIIGVVQRGPKPGLQNADIWTPLGLSRTALTSLVTMVHPASKNMLVIGVAEPGRASIISQELAAIAAQLAVESPASHEGWSARARPLRDALGEDSRPAVLALSIAVGLLLLLACVNVANLNIARAIRQAPDAALRISLGAHSTQVAALQLLEVGMIAAAGIGLGLLAAVTAMPLVLRLIPSAATVITTAHVDQRAVLAAVGATILTVLISGSAPSALQRRVRPATILLQSTRRSTGSQAMPLLRRVFVGGQIALATVLAASAIATVRELAATLERSPGFNANQLTALHLTLSGDRYATMPKRAAFVQELLARLRALPGIEAAALTTNRTFNANASQTTIAIEGKTTSPAEQVSTRFRRISDDYFRTLQLTLLAGRAFTAHDNADGVPVAIVSQSAAAAFWPGESALGKRVRRSGGTHPWLTVVGVVDDALDNGLNAPPAPTLYIPYQQNSSASVSLVVRARAQEAALNAQLREAIRAADATLPVDRMISVQRLLYDSVDENRFRARVLASLALLGLLMAVLGVYSISSYFVLARTREIGVRMALGSTSARIAALVLRDSAITGTIGIGTGLAAAVLLGSVTGPALGELLRPDWSVLSWCAPALFVAALAATALPAWRASRIAPADAIRT